MPGCWRACPRRAPHGPQPPGSSPNGSSQETADSGQPRVTLLDLRRVSGLLKYNQLRTRNVIRKLLAGLNRRNPVMPADCDQCRAGNFVKPFGDVIILQVNAESMVVSSVMINR